MRKPFLFLAICFVGGIQSAIAKPDPEQIPFYCELDQKRPGWVKTLQRTEVKWGITTEAQLALIAEEWGLGPNEIPAWWKPAWADAKRGRPSIAPGYLDATWERYEFETGNKHASYKELSDFSDFMGWYVSSAADQVGLLPGDAKGLYILWKRGVRYYQTGHWRTNTAMIYRSENFAERARQIAESMHACPEPKGKHPTANFWGSFALPEGVARPFRGWSWRSKRGPIN